MEMTRYDDFRCLGYILVLQHARFTISFKHYNGMVNTQMLFRSVQVFLKSLHCNKSFRDSPHMLKNQTRRVQQKIQKLSKCFGSFKVNYGRANNSINATLLTSI
ncbi:uncharacterized protein isoform X1 [Rhodnius prolixus]|uniref:uncharacterized protein isoform X1 n=1 Tax=Rhodnius prolixus TaxID=13249 RepID=UPI003D187DCC